MYENRQKIALIGIGTGTPDLLTSQAEKRIRESSCLIGAGRMLQCARQIPGLPRKPEFEEYRADRIVPFLETHGEYRDAAVLLSGDPGFFSGAEKLRKELSRRPDRFETEIIPGVSTPAYLAARLGISWEDAVLASLHGTEGNFIRMVDQNSKTFLLLGGSDSGKRLLEGLREYGLGDVILYAGRRLAYPDEQIQSGHPGDFREQDLDGLCAVFVINPSPCLRRGPHRRDREFIRGDVPMTKEEVRAVSIARLELEDGAVVYDVGAGTGSVSVEAALSGECIRVYAVEKSREAVRLLRENQRKFRADGIRIIEGEAPEALRDLEPPTHVFIGGSSGRLREILQEVRRKNPQARIVINAVSLETVEEVMQAEKAGLLEQLEVTQMTVSRARQAGTHHLMTGMNPVYIFSAGGGKE